MSGRRGSAPDAFEAALNARKSGRRSAMKSVALRARFEAALAVVFFCVVSLLLIGAFSLAVIEARNGYIDPPLLEQVPDRRILRNMRAGDMAPFADAVFEDTEGVLLAIRRDGQVHRIDRRTELVSEENLREDEGTQSDVLQASLGCGTLGGDGSEDVCGLDGVVFATTRRGGLAMRTPGSGWRTLVGDAAWIGQDGQPVEHADLVAWAGSDDGLWVLMSAGPKGLGLFDVATSSMRTVGGPTQAFAESAGGGIAHVRYRQGRFWIAGDMGLAALDVAPGTLNLQEIISARILDMEPSLQEAWLVVAETPCDASTCLSLQAVDRAGSARVLVGETEHHPALSHDALDYAVAQGSTVVVAGVGGLFAYDSQQRAWSELAKGTVAAHRTDLDGTLHAAIGSEIISVQGGSVTGRRVVPIAPIMQVVRTSDDTLLAVSEAGTVARVSDGAVLFTPTPTPFDPGAADRVAALGNRVFATTPDGLLIHDVDRSRYQWIARKALPPPLRSDAELVAADGKLWAVSRAAGWVALLYIEADGPTPSVESSGLVPLGGPIATVSAWDSGLILTGVDGVPYQISTGADGPMPIPQVGAARPDARALTALAGDSSRTVASHGNDVLEYDHTTRAWDRLQRFDPAQFLVRDLALGKQAYALGQNGRVLEVGSGFQYPIVGAGPTWPFASSDVSDARQHLGLVYLGGDGMVAAYDLVAGAIRSVWRSGQGAVRIADFDGDVPLWLSGGKAYLGNAEISNPGEVIHTGWISGQSVVLARQEEASMSLRITAIRRQSDDPNAAQSPALPDRCYYTRPAPAGTGFGDAAGIGAGRTLVLTDKGPEVYDQQARRWVQLAGVPKAADRIAWVGQNLALQNDDTLWWLPGLQLANACSEDKGVATVKPSGAVSHALAPDGSSVALIAPDGGISLATGPGAEIDVLAAPTSAPQPSKLGRAVPGTPASIVHFAGLDGIWTYDAKERVWHRAALTSLPVNATAVDMRPLEGGTFAVTVWTDAGSAWGGEFKPRTPAAPVPLSEVQEPILTGFPHPGGDILDVSAQGDNLFFLTRSRLLVFSKTGRHFYRDLALPHVNEDWSLNTLYLYPVLEDGDNNRWVLPKDPRGWTGSAIDQSAAFIANAPDRAAALIDDKNLNLLRITDRGAVLICALQKGKAAADTCKEHIPQPIALPRSDILEAFQFSEGWAIVKPDGLYHLQGDNRTITRFAGGEAVTGEAQFFKAGTSVFAADQQGTIRWIKPDRTVAVVASGVLDVITSRIGTVYLRDARGFSQLDDTGGVALVGPEGGRFLQLAAFTEDGRLQSVDDRGFFVDGQGRRLTDAPQFPVTRNTIAAHFDRFVLDRGQSRAPGAWLQDGSGRVRYWSTRACRAPDPTAPAFARENTSAVGASCLYLALEFDAPQNAAGQAERLLRVTSDQGRRVLVFETQDIRIDAGQPIGTPQSRTAPIWPAPAFVSSQADTLRSQVSELGDREVLFAPRMSVTSDWVSVAVGQENTSWPGATDPVPITPMDEGWVRFDRQDRSFALNNLNMSLPAEDAVSEGRFIWASSGAWSFLGGDTWIKATARGMFFHRNDGRIVTGWSKAVAQVPVALDLGQFVFGDGTRADYAQQPVPANLNRRILIDELAIETDVVSGQAITTVPVSGQVQPALTASGFVFDQREVVGWIDGTLHFGSHEVMGPVDRIAGLIQMPGGGADAVISQSNEVFARQGKSYFKRFAAGGWVPASDPRLNAVLSAGRGLVWSRVNGQGEIGPQNAAETWRAERSDLGFHADRLIDVTAYAKQIIAATSLGLHQFPGLNALLVSAQGKANAPTLVRAVDHEVTGPNTGVFWAETDQGRLVLDPTSGSWGPQVTQPAPWQERTPVSGGAVTVTLRNGTANFARRSENLDGVDRFFPFRWARETRFPFDDARSVFARGETIWVGTGAGLRILTRKSANTLNSRLMAVDRRTKGQPDPVDAIGRPLAFADEIHARAGGVCVTLSDPQHPGCSSSGLDARVLADTDRWLWVKQGARLLGQYRDKTKATFGAPIKLDDPRWPHDTLLTASGCGGHRHEIWQDGSVISRDEVLSDIAFAGATGVACLKDARVLDKGVRLPQGTYVTGKVPLVAQDDWEGVPDALQDGVNAIHDHALYRSRFRVTHSPREQGLQIQHRDRADAWQDIGWENGHLRIDSGGPLAHADGAVWRYASDQFVDTKVGKDSLLLDLDKLAILQMDPLAAKGTCAPDRIASHDGTDADWPGRAMNPSHLRCADGRIFEAQFGPTAAARSISLTQDDPFTDRVLVDAPGLWDWRNPDADTGKRGHLDIHFRDEPVLLEGRFPFDTYRGIAQVTPDNIDVIAADGWWQSASEGPELAKTLRPTETRIDVAAVQDLVPDPEMDGAQITDALCILAGNRRGILLPDGALEPATRCSRITGKDGFWTYFDSEDGLLASGEALNGGTVRRDLFGGRFGDLFVQVPPVGDSSNPGVISLRTVAGITVLDPDRGVRGVYVRGPEDLAVPGPEGQQLVLSPNGVIETAHSGFCPNLALRKTPNLVSRGIQRLPGDTYEITHVDPETGSVMIREHVLCAATARPLPWYTKLDTSDRFRAKLNSARWPDLETAQNVWLTQGALFSGTARVQIETPLPNSEVAVRVLADELNGKVYVVTESDIWQMNGDVLMKRLRRAEDRQDAAEKAAEP